MCIKIKSNTYAQAYENTQEKVWEEKHRTIARVISWGRNGIAGGGNREEGRTRGKELCNEWIR